MSAEARDQWLLEREKLQALAEDGIKVHEPHDPEYVVCDALLQSFAEFDRLRAEVEGLRAAINAHNADCIDQCEQRKQMGKTHCPMKGYDRECSDCPRDGMLDLDAARTPKEPDHG